MIGVHQTCFTEQHSQVTNIAYSLHATCPASLQTPRSEKSQPKVSIPLTSLALVPVNAVKSCYRCASAARAIWSGHREPTLRVHFRMPRPRSQDWQFRRGRCGSPNTPSAPEFEGYCRGQRESSREDSQDNGTDSESGCTIHPL